MRGMFSGGAMIAALLWSANSVAAPGAAVAQFAEITYEAGPEVPVEPGRYRNPILPGFHPDPSIVRVGHDFYLVTSTFAWFPGVPVFHSRDLVNWRLVSHAIERPEQVDFSNLGIARGIFAPAISWHDGKFYLFTTCVDCRGNFYVTADRAEGPWSDPVWLDFEGIDPSLFVDDDGRAWVLNNGAPEGDPRYDGHRAIWIQQIDLVAGRMIGPRKVLVDGGVNPQDNPIWAEGPHIYKVDGWYYLMAAEGGTAEDHSETIYRSRTVDGPYVAGPANPILTQRDMSPTRPDRVEATGHADLVKLDDGTWWGVFLATRPFAGQSTLLGRETWLLPVRWENGWPTFLDPGEPVPIESIKPALSPSPATDWSRWTERFEEQALSPEWLRMRTPSGEQWYSLGGGLKLTARADTAGGRGEPSFLGRRLRHPVASVTTRLSFDAQRDGDFAGLLALIDDEHFLALGVEQVNGARVLALRTRSSADQSERGELKQTWPLAAGGEIELKLAIDRGHSDLAWRPSGALEWRQLASRVDVEFFSSIHAGLFTGVLVGPYAVSGD